MIHKGEFAMVNLLTGPKGSGKTQQMIEQANAKAKECNGNVVFIKKTHRDTASVAFDKSYFAYSSNSFFIFIPYLSERFSAH